MTTQQIELVAREVSEIHPRTEEDWAEIFKSLWTQDLYGTLKKGMLMGRFHDEWYVNQGDKKGKWAEVCKQIIGVSDSTYYLYRRIYVYFESRPQLLEEHWGQWPRDPQALVSIIRALEIVPEDPSAVTRHMSLDMSRDAANARFEEINKWRKKQIGEDDGVEEEEGDEEEAVGQAREAGMRSRREEINEVRGQINEEIERDARVRTLLELWLDARDLWDLIARWSNMIGWENLEVVLRQMWKRGHNQ